MLNVYRKRPQQSQFDCGVYKGPNGKIEGDAISNLLCYNWITAWVTSIPDKQFVSRTTFGLYALCTATVVLSFKGVNVKIDASAVAQALNSESSGTDGFHLIYPVCKQGYFLATCTVVLECDCPYSLSPPPIVNILDLPLVTMEGTYGKAGNGNGNENTTDSPTLP